LLYGTLIACAVAFAAGVRAVFAMHWRLLWPGIVLGAAASRDPDRWKLVQAAKKNVDADAMAKACSD